MNIQTALQWHKSTIVALALIAGLLSGCGGSGSGSKIEENPNPCINKQGENICTSNDPITYNGKPAANADIEKFRTALWSKLTEQKHCGGCHQTQAPVFARRDDINLAYEAVLADNLVNLQSPADSRERRLINQLKPH